MLACCLVNSDSDFLFHAGVFVRAYDLELTYNALSRMSVWCPVRDKSLTLFLAAASSVSFNFHLCLILCLIFAIAAEIILSHVQLNIKHLLFFPTFHSQPSDSPSAEIYLTINMYNISGNNICMPVSKGLWLTKATFLEVWKVFCLKFEVITRSDLFLFSNGLLFTIKFKVCFWFLWWIQLTLLLNRIMPCDWNWYPLQCLHGILTQTQGDFIMGKGSLGMEL